MNVTLNRLKHYVDFNWLLDELTGRITSLHLAVVAALRSERGSASRSTSESGATKCLRRPPVLRNRCASQRRGPERGSVSRSRLATAASLRENPNLDASRRAAGRRPVVFGTQNACGVLPLSPREERAGREPERGGIDKKRLLSPALSSFFEEERERIRGCVLKANLRPNTQRTQRTQRKTYERSPVVVCTSAANRL